MIEKTIEAVIMIHLKQIMKAHNMLSEQQMKEYQDCFTETVLDLLINQIHEI